MLTVCTSDAALSEPNAHQQVLAESPIQNLALNLRDDAPRSARVGCAELPLPGDAGAVRWSTLIAPDDPLLTADALTLQGTANGERLVVSEVFSHRPEPAASAPPTASLPGGVAPVWRAFGREERARVRADGRLMCAAGQAPAGFVATLARAQAASGQQILRMVARGRGPFEIGLSNPDRLARESPMALGTLSADKGWRVHEFPLQESRTDWAAVTVACPGGETELEVRSLSLHADRQQRSAWMWAPALWQNMPEKIWAWARTHRLNTVMITVPVQQAQVADAEVLRRFLTEATRRNVAVWAVAGDPHDVLPGSEAALRARLTAYRDYNQAATADARLAGAQLDIEPYLLPGYRLNPDAWRDAYLATVRSAREQLGASVALDMVVPVWWGTDRHWGTRWLDAIAAPNVSLTVMNYRTEDAALMQGAAPFLDWATRHGRQVTMALELGPIPDETRWSFIRGQGSGELWALPVGKHMALVLFDQAISGLSGSTWRYQRSQDFSGKYISFAGAPDKLDRSVERLVPAWSAWPGFRGVAIHGLDATP